VAKQPRIQLKLTGRSCHFYMSSCLYFECTKKDRRNTVEVLLLDAHFRHLSRVVCDFTVPLASRLLPRETFMHGSIYNLTAFPKRKHPYSFSRQEQKKLHHSLPCTTTPSPLPLAKLSLDCLYLVINGDNQLHVGGRSIIAFPSDNAHHKVPSH
jgi:hypothetical protein